MNSRLAFLVACLLSASTGSPAVAAETAAAPGDAAAPGPDAAAPPAAADPAAPSPAAASEASRAPAPATGTPAADAGDVGISEKLGQTVDLEATLRDEAGAPVTLKQFIDKPTVLTLNYFRCAGICTPLLLGVGDVLAKVDLEPGRDFQVVTVSFDPTDTAEIAARKRTNYLKQIGRAIPPSSWRFLTGEEAATRRVCDSVGFAYRKEGDQFVHAGAIIVLSPEGKVTRYMYGTSYLASDLSMAIREASKGEVRPTISKLLAFCFSYDSTSKRYVFRMTRVVGAFTLLFVAGFGVFVLFQGRRRKTEVARSDPAAGSDATGDARN